MSELNLLKMKRGWIYLLSASTLFVIDQLIKSFSIKNTLPEMGGFLARYCNPNIAWSIPINGTFFWFIWLTVVVLIAYNLKKSFNLFLLLVLFGAFSNALDRITRDCVVDYINLGFFPVFNIADIMITIGIILFIFQEFFTKKSNQNYSS